MKIKLKKFKIVKSTNDMAIKLIKKKNFSEPVLITSEKQIGGKGTAGKKWISKKGNLFITIFFKLEKLKINFRQFAVLNALFLKKIISQKVAKEIKIKWPNDLLFEGKKFCGILQEIIKVNKFNYLIVGIGLNTNIAPKDKSFESTCLKNIINKKVSNQKILKNILVSYAKLLKQAKKLSFSELKKDIIE